MKLFWQRLLKLILCLGLIACNDSAPPPTPSGAPVIEASNAKSASIGTRGGKVTTTAANGVTYTLIVPPNALKETLSITLTPISSMGNAPLSAGVTAAVQMEPSGLSFKRSAKLQIGVVSSVAAGKRLFGFGTANDGTKFRFNSPTVQAGLTELKINHFSDAGIGNATDAEIDQVPALEPLGTPTANDFNDQIDMAATYKETDQDIAKYFEDWFSQIIKPLLLDAESSSDLNKIIDADLAFEKWFDARVNIAASSEGKINVEPFLTDEDAIARPIVAKLLLTELNQRIESCKTDPVIADKFTALYLISLMQNLALKFQMDTAAFKLDTASVSQKINDCARVVIDPIKPFTQIVVGSDRSLDAQAQVVFTGTPDPQVAGFEFKVSASGATLKQASGFSSSDGRYTTVFTPTNKVFVLSVQACLVLPGNLEASSLCATQDARSVVSDGIFRGTISLTGSFELAFSTNTPTSTSTVSEKTNLFFEASVELNPSNANTNRMTSKNATFNFVEARDTTDQIPTGLDCLVSRRIQKNATAIGTSQTVETGEKVALSVNGTAYTLELQKILGGYIYKGVDTNTLSLLKGTCDLDPNTTTPFEINNVTAPYLPNFFEKPRGTGTIITNPDGSRSMTGSLTINGTDPAGAGLTRNYTMTWNLTAF
jgi:hypothetical protein